MPKCDKAPIFCWPIPRIAQMRRDVLARRDLARQKFRRACQHAAPRPSAWWTDPRAPREQSKRSATGGPGWNRNKVVVPPPISSGNHQRPAPHARPKDRQTKADNPVTSLVQWPTRALGGLGPARSACPIRPLRSRFGRATWRCCLRSATRAFRGARIGPFVGAACSALFEHLTRIGLKMLRLFRSRFVFLQPSYEKYA